jgi:type 1 glutamine amidotransferase
MRRLTWIPITLLLATVLAGAAVTAPAPDPSLPRVLFFSDPQRSDNEIIRRKDPNVPSTAERYFADYAKRLFEATVTQDPAEVSRERLTRYRAVVFFTAIQPPVDREALVEWVRNGGAFTGIHSTANTFQAYVPFGELLGAFYESRPWRTRERPLVKVTVKVEDRAHPATKHLGAAFEITDDIYLFKQWDRNKVHLLLSIDPGSLDLTKVRQPDRDYPVAWTKTYGKGRVFYTALGDDEAVWRDPRYRAHLLGGIRWTMGMGAE